MIKSYRIIRHYQNDEIPKEIIATGLTLEEAQKHCRDRESSSSTATSDIARARTKKFGPWFDGWTEEIDGWSEEIVEYELD